MTLKATAGTPIARLTAALTQSTKSLPLQVTSSDV